METKGHLPNGLDDFMSSIMVFILKIGRGKILNTSQINSTALQIFEKKTKQTNKQKKRNTCHIFYFYNTLGTQYSNMK